MTVLPPLHLQPHTHAHLMFNRIVVFSVSLHIKRRVRVNKHY